MVAAAIQQTGYAAIDRWLTIGVRMPVLLSGRSVVTKLSPSPELLPVLPSSSSTNHPNKIVYFNLMVLLKNVLRFPMV